MHRNILVEDISKSVRRRHRHRRMYVKLDKNHLQPSHIASDWNKCATESGAHVSK